MVTHEGKHESPIKELVGHVNLGHSEGDELEEISVS